LEREKLTEINDHLEQKRKDLKAVLENKSRECRNTFLGALAVISLAKGKVEKGE
jgi:hypothetical protein